MTEKKTNRPVTAKKKVRVKSKKKVAPLSKQQTFHISKSVMNWMICKPVNNWLTVRCIDENEILNQQELEDFEL